MRELVNLITIQQGANLKFDISILDDEAFKLLYTAFLDKHRDLIGDNRFEGLTLLLSSGIEQSILSDVTNKLLSDILTEEMVTELVDIFQSVQSVDLVGKQVKIYLQIFKSASSNKTMKFDYVGSIGQAGKVYFNIPAEDTQIMVHKFNRDFEEQLLGFYTIELQDESTKEIIRVLEGDLEISRGAKNECEFQGTEENIDSVV